MTRSLICLAGAILIFAGAQALPSIAHAQPSAGSEGGPYQDITPDAIQQLENEFPGLEERMRRAVRDGNLYEAEPLFDTAYRAWVGRFGPNNEFAAETALQLASFKARLGRLAEAEALVLTALAYYETTATSDPIGMSVALGNVAGVLQLQGRLDLALTTNGRAIALLENNYRDRLRALIYLRDQRADFLIAAGQYREAGALYQSIIDYATYTMDPGFAISVNNGLGLVRERLGDLERAEAYYINSLEFTETITDPDTRRATRETARCALGAFYERTGRLDEAEALLRQCLDHVLETMENRRPEALENAALLVSAQVGQGEGDRNLRRSSQQLFDILQAQDREERATVENSISHAEGYALYADAAWLATGGNRLDQSILALQQTLSGPSGRAIAEMAARHMAGGTRTQLTSLVQDREAASAQIANLSEQIRSGFDTAGAVQGDRQRLIRLRREAESRIATIDAQIARDFPDYFALINPQPVALRDAQALLSDDEAILLAVPSAYGTHVVAITNEGAEWHRADLNVDAIDGTVRRLRWDLGARVEATEYEIAEWESDYPDSGAFPFDRQAAFALYTALVAPVEDVIGDRSALYVVAGGQLAALPFSVLVTDEPQGRDHDPDALRNTTWLADRYALASIPSIQSLQLLRQVERSEGGAITPDFAGFGDPVLQGEAQQRGFRNLRTVPSANAILSWNQSATRARMADVTMLSQLTRLPGTATELENIRQALGAPEESIRLAEQATETAVRTADLADVRIIAFATHGLMPEDLSILTEPGLVFTPPAVATDNDDGYLSASEVASLRLDADWVILSACNTATGEEGSGLSSLARSFFYAGARNLLASHWPVDDQVASRMTVRMFEILRDTPGLSRLQAFQQSMREIRMETGRDTAQTSWAHPAFWAPFVLIGSGS